MVYGIAFCIPLIPRVVPLLIVLFSVLSLFAIFKKYSRVTLSEESILMILLYAIHLIGMLYTENVARGGFDLEVKLSLVAFPIAFIGFKFLNSTNYKNVLKLFLLGTMLSGLFCMAQSAYQVFVLGMPDFFFLTSRFSVIVHPSYFAMYLIFSLLVLAYLRWPLIEKSNIRQTLLNLFVFIFLSICVLFTGSKIGMIMWFVFIVGLMIALVRVSKTKWVPIVGITLLVSLIGGVFQTSSPLQRRVSNLMKVAQTEEVNPATNESSALRVLVYQAAWDIIRDQSWFGQGTGDFQDKLDESYASNGYTTALKKHLNTHNLFIQFWISFGIPGVILLSGLFVLMFYHSIRRSDYVYIGFTSVFFLISLTESTLYVQAGVVFFSFFTVFLSRRSMSKQSLSERPVLAS